MKKFISLSVVLISSLLSEAQAIYRPAAEVVNKSEYIITSLSINGVRVGHICPYQVSSAFRLEDSLFYPNSISYDITFEKVAKGGKVLEWDHLMSADIDHVGDSAMGVNLYTIYLTIKKVGKDRYGRTQHSVSVTAEKANIKIELRGRSLSHMTYAPYYILSKLNGLLPL